MTHLELREKFFRFWEDRGHKKIPSASLVPENDPTTLFTSSGMQPLIQYFLGQPHPIGRRIVDSQKCLRIEDIEEVGDNRHTTFFEMLGNWSFGDYFKKEQLPWFFEFLTGALKLDPTRLYVTAFAGDAKNKVLINGTYQMMGPDEESINIWKELFKSRGIEAKEVSLGSLAQAGEKGMHGERIFLYDVKKNWWSRSGAPDEMPVGEPGGPDSEVFYEFPQIEHDKKFGKYCHPNCNCGRYLELGNSVFMQYKKESDGVFVELPNKNVDFGGGLERQTAAFFDNPDVFETEFFTDIIKEVEKISGKSYSDSKNRPAIRTICDHIKSATFLIKDDVVPSNKERGYILRRLIRRAAVKMHSLGGGLTPNFDSIADSVIRLYDGIYFDRSKDREKIFNILGAEVNKFAKTLDRGLREFEKVGDQNTGLFAFNLFQTFGFPVEVTKELLEQKGIKFDQGQFDEAFRGHQELSRTASAGMFKGGLVDHSEQVTKYHTATHLLHAALRKVLGSHARQEGSNLTGERLRFDFANPIKLTPEQIKEVEDLVNDYIAKNLVRDVETMNYTDAVKSGALAFFKERYPDKVTVYTFRDPSTSSGFISREICGGPHVEHTGILGKFKITREEAVASGVRRIYAELS